MKFFADFHIHSRYSRATSASLNLEQLGKSAIRKGLALIGTGDFTHPGWMKEIDEHLVEAEPGLYRLKDNTIETRFILTAEISTIYKQGDKVRKVHHLLGAPSIEVTKKIAASLAGIGNILSDGRPILGITSRNLLEIVLEGSDKAFLIPAHIWTPWFSVLGSKSGFDSIAECYLDLEPHIFAVETGLSSDPPMNWRVRSLDRYHLVSNSDAHSAEKLGREATIFDTDMDYFSIRKAMAFGEGLLGTVEFFPEEGKYHMDGHRDCGVMLSPDETRKLGGRCPKCGRLITVGVLSRVEDLADRPEGEKPVSARPFHSLIPLTEILGEILQVGSISKKVTAAYDRLISNLGGELPLLLERDIDEIRSVAGETLSLAVSRMRAGEVCREGGFDGQFGKVKVFRDNERDMLFPDGLLAAAAKEKKTIPVRKKKQNFEQTEIKPVLTFGSEQEQAVCHGRGALMVVAGPGTGKTRVLVERMKRLMEKGENSILAITFTNKAAGEIRERLGDSRAEVTTFHSLAARIMRDAGVTFAVADEELMLAASPPLHALFPSAGGEGNKILRERIENLVFRQSTCMDLDEGQAALVKHLREQGYYTYEGLILEACRLLQGGSFVPAWDHVMVDEFQDINPVQYRFLKLLTEKAGSVLVIGDPSQAIYGFRGSSPRAFDDFIDDNPSCARFALRHTYRLSTPLGEASNAFIGRRAVESPRDGAAVRIVRAEYPGEYISREIEALAGGLSHRGVGRARADYALSDMAVIVRTQAQAVQIMESLAKASIPCDTACARPLAEVRGVRERIALLEGRGWEGCVKGIGDTALARIRSGEDPGDTARMKIEEGGSFLSMLAGTVSDRISEIEGSGMFKLPHLEGGHPFYQYAGLYGDEVDRFGEFLRLSSDQGLLGGEKVHVLTAHAAKGLEFRCVFLTGLARGIFPLNGASPEEERNLFYVAMTRASQLLTMVCPVNGESEFVSLIPEDYKDMIALKEMKRRSSQMFLFD
jgi:DNA helicase II / ATP-dependent DNA helicase PcrA